MPVIAAGNTAWAGSGLGTPLRTAVAPVNGVNGTFANNNAGAGALLIQTTTGVLYQNSNTAASPTWVKVSSE
jgi:hypothetical protein